MKSEIHKILAFFLCLLVPLLSACSPQAPISLPDIPGDPLTGNGSIDRQLLSYADLTSTAPDLTSPVDDGAFRIPEQAAPPTHTFEGILRLRNTLQGGQSNAIKDDFGIARNWNGPISLPEHDFEFIQHGSHLIPSRQGLIYTGHSFFNMIVGPGRAWNESSDQGMTRATFPVTLVQRNQNCTFNGVMAFLFDDKNISQVRYQFTQETCGYFKINLWGQLKAEYRPQKVKNAADIVQKHADEISNRMPEKPIEDLLVDFPQAGIDLAGFTKTIDATHVTTFGVVVNGIHYNAGCPTRFGHYAYCAQIRMASYSTAKSAFAGIAMMRLGQKYGPLFYTLPLKDYVPEVKKSSNDWSNVRIYHTLDLRTGMFRSTDEEGSAAMDAFIDSESYKDKMDAAVNFPKSADPGVEFVYKTSDTFIGTVAMDKFYKENEGGKADIFNMVRDEVYQPIHLSAGMMTILRTDNRDSGMPLGGLGLFWSPDDVAKMAVFLNNANGTIQGKAVLDSAKMREIFHRDRNGQIDPDNSNHYKSGFWVEEFTKDKYPEYGCEFWVPYMSGYGGISIAMLPDGVNFYLFSDNYEFGWETAVWELNKIATVCPPAQSNK